MKNHYGYLLKTTWRFAVGHRFALAITYVLFVIANVFTMLEPYVFGLMINALQQGKEPLLYWVTLYLGLYASLSFFFWIFHGIGRVVERQISFHTVKAFNETMFNEVAHLPMKWHKDHHSGEVMSRVRKASDALSRFSDESYTYVITVVQFVTSLIAIFILLPKFGFLALGLGVLIVAMIFRFDRSLVRNLKAVNERTHEAQATLYDYVSNISTVITLRLERLAQQALVQKILRIFPPLKRNIVVNELKWFSISMALALMNFVVIFFYIYPQIRAGEVILVGSLIALYQYTSRFVEVFFRLAWQYEQLVWFHTDLKTVDPIHDAYQKWGRKISMDAFPSKWNHVAIRGLVFRFEDEKHRVHNLHNLNLDLRPGLKIALVGESGSGKSTLMSLLRGLNEPDRVKMIVDGKVFRSLVPLSETVTLIPQDPEIFDNTIEYNVTAGLRHTEREIREVSRLARFDKILKRLPKGLKTHIKEKGVNLSGGEKQRLALARGLFAARHSRSQLLLLDEPTSSVDSRNEAAIYDHLFAAFKDICLISSIHRLHLLRRFDVIYFFEEGKVVGCGSFETLLKQNKSFRFLWGAYQRSATQT